jgi:hypothetical protein
MKRWLLVSCLAALNTMVFSINAIASELTFNTGPTGYEFHTGGSYTENGMTVTSYSESAYIGGDLLAAGGSTDPANGPSGGQLYLHSGYVEFAMTDKSTFTLNSFIFETNGGIDGRYIITSKEPSIMYYLNAVTQYNDRPYYRDTLTFSNSLFSDITWFQIYSNGGATQIDNANFTPKASPVPIPGAAWLLGSGLVGLVGLGRKRQSK